MKEKYRTEQQNKALHKWYAQLAKALNDDGFDMRVLIDKEIDIPWSAYTIKEHLWRPLQDAMFGKKSTTKLYTKEIDIIYDVINKTVGERTNIHVPFPCIDELINSNK